MTIDIIIVRLLPNPPTDAITFKQYITDLSIECYDQNITNVDETVAPNGADEVLLGKASGLVSFSENQSWESIVLPMEIPDPEPGQKKKLPNSIIQHIAARELQDFPLPTSGVLKAVATAVIVVDIQPPEVASAHKEYPTATAYDVRLAVKRNGVALEAPSVEWNATCYTVDDLSPFAVDYMGISTNPIMKNGFPSMKAPSMYALIPAAPVSLPAGTAAILLDKNGNPPPFDDLINGVNLVLGKYGLDDGTKLENLDSPLTEAQSLEIASEIVYNRAWFPLPPPAPTSSPSLEDLYTSPSTDNDMQRTKFEGNLAAYHAKLDADARRLAAYISAASAAVAAERMSAQASMALFTFPLDPRMLPSTQLQSLTTSSQSTAQLSVVLTSWDAFSTPPPSESASAPIDPSFVVPAAYFYALGYQLPPSMKSELRYRSIVNGNPDSIKTTITAAVGMGILRPSESTVTRGGSIGTNVSVNTAQAVRRLCALLPNVVNMLGGLTGSGTSVSSQTPHQPVLAMALVSGLVTLWRDFEQQDPAFWITSRFDDDSYLNLILQIVASGDPILKPAIASTPLVPAQVPPAPAGSPPTVIKHAYDLPRITTEGWKGLFLSGPSPPPLPAWTAPGDEVNRIEAFVRRLQHLFSVAWKAPSSSGGTASDVIPVLDPGPSELAVLPSGYGPRAGDVLAVFLQSASGFSFEGDWDDGAVDEALAVAFPDPSPPRPSSFGDDGAEKLRRWLKATLKTLWTLVHITNFSGPIQLTPQPTPLDPYKRFAYMESLYSRGFVSAEDIAVLSLTQFVAGLSGTVIEPDHIPTIHALAVQLPHNIPTSGIEPAWGFEPANPGGAEALVNCIPATALDPLGRVAYLHDMLRIALRLSKRESNLASTSATNGENESQPATSATLVKKLEELVSERRGDVGSLRVSAANLETTVAVTDLVLESLEALGAWAAKEQSETVPHGAVFDTTSNPAADLLGLCTPGGKDNGGASPKSLDDQHGRTTGEKTPKDGSCCIPGLPSSSELLAAIPEHSHPAIHLEQPEVYHKLETTFTSPLLPFARQLDITRSYLACIGTRRFDVMRRFRRDITEFALDPAKEPPQWQAHAWRFPVSIEIGLEYLGLSKEEYSKLYTCKLVEDHTAGLYGLQRSELWWGRTALTLNGFMQGLGLTYCEVLKLKDSGFIDFTLTASDYVRPQSAAISHSHAGDDHQHGLARAGGKDDAVALVQDRDCPPCCLNNWRILFPATESNEDIGNRLKQLAVFVRLWRTLNTGCHHKLSFHRLADICTVLCLFDEKGTVNPCFIRHLISLLMLVDFFGLPWSDEHDLEDSVEQKDDETQVRGSNRTKILTLWDFNVPKPPETSPARDWAVCAMIDAAQRYAEKEYHATPANVGSPKIIAANLDHIAALAGFIPGAGREKSWQSDPVCTLRFAEVLAKICASRFTIGEVLFLFTVKDHVDGEDPFPIAPTLEISSQPFSSLPDDESRFNLQALRMKLLCAADEDDSGALNDNAYDGLDWSCVQDIISRLGYTSFHASQSDAQDALQSLAERFFPSALARSGLHSSSAKSTEWTAPLSPDDTSPGMWAVEPCEPFRYRATSTEKPRSGELYICLPLRDEAVLAKLQATRQLNPRESLAVQELYFAPRAALSPFALLFRNFGYAVEFLVQAEERERWRFFVHEVRLFERRARIIAKHIAMHVRHIANDSKATCFCDSGMERSECDMCCSPGDIALAVSLLKHLVADENRAMSPWENNSGTPPERFQWDQAPTFSGGALAALLGVAGTGLHGEIRTVPGAEAVPGTGSGGAIQRWEEIRGGLRAFGLVRDHWNCPVLTVIPELSVRPLSVATREVVSFRNGLAWRNRDGQLLGGAEPFRCEWTGVLLIDHAGCYIFRAGSPGDAVDGCPAPDGCDDDVWSVTLKKGQRTYKLLSHNSIDQGKTSVVPSFVSSSVQLHQGAYTIHVVYKQADPQFMPAEAITRTSTGFEVRYEGPQTQFRCILVPLGNLMLKSKDLPMGSFRKGHEDSLSRFLRHQYTPSIRDARRTYQRVIKAVLFARRFCLSAEEPAGCWSCEGLSELEYLLGHGAHFKGTAYYRCDGEKTGSASPYHPHHAYLDFNLLPVSDPYLAPSEDVDSRVNPSAQRQAALFDVWERVFDYVQLRDELCHFHKRQRHQLHNQSATRGQLWAMFHEAGSQNPTGSQSANDDAADLALEYLNVDIGLKDTLLNYFQLKDSPATCKQGQEPALYHIMAVPDLQDERWAIRLWHARAWAKRLVKNFQTEVLEKTRPALWAASDDALELEFIAPGDKDTSGHQVPRESGVHNLVRFVQYSLLGIDPDHLHGGVGLCGDGSRLSSLQNLNDGLRLRARNALVAFLCQMDRVPLPFGSGVFSTADGFCTMARELNDLLLQDVEARLDERTSRIQDAIIATQRLATRLRIGLEPQLLMATGDRTDLDQRWECQFASFQVWSANTRRTLYAENWAAWDELRSLESTEAGRFMTHGLKHDATTLAKPGRPVWFTADTIGADGREGVAPGTAGLDLQQANQELATLGTHQGSTLQNLLLMATPDNIPRPTLLSLGLFPTEPRDDSRSRANFGEQGPSQGDTHGEEDLSQVTPATTSPSAADTLRTVATKTYGVNLPMWIESAIRLGSHFIRVAAAGRPPAFAYQRCPAPPPTPPSDKDSAVALDEERYSSPFLKSSACCSNCQNSPKPPLVDEYYFWLAPANLYNPKDAPQDADIGTSSVDDPSAPAWNNPDAEADERNAQKSSSGESDQDPDAAKKTAQLLTWKPRPAIALYWACVHNGCLLNPKRSATYVKPEILPRGSRMFLQLVGRCVDSLFFTVVADNSVQVETGGSSEGDDGHDSQTPPSGPLGTALGFRYDLASDTAVALPQTNLGMFAIQPPFSNSKGPLASFSAYPRFIYFAPGAPLAPTTVFGAALAIASKLRDRCCFPAALDWYRAAYDPLARDNSWALCRRFSANSSRITFGNSIDGIKHQTTSEVDDGEGERDLRMTSLDPTSRKTRDSSDTRTVILDSTCCPTTADACSQPRLVRSRAVLLEYLETMLEWADTIADESAEGRTGGFNPKAEAAQHALVLIETMQRLLGPGPKTVAAHPDPRLEQVMSVSKFVASDPPLNPRLLRLYDEVADRLSTMRRQQSLLCVAAEGSHQPRSNAALSCLAYVCPSWPSTRSGMAQAAQPYRFTAVYPKAVELAGLVRNLANSLTSAYERGDGVYLSALRTSHERTLLELGTSTAQQQWRSADWEVDALEQAMKAALARRRYYVALRDGGTIPGEQSHVSGTETAMDYSKEANVSENLGNVFSLFPDLATGVAGQGPLVKTELPIGTKMAAAAGAIARVLNTASSISTTQAGLSLTQAGWDRRLVEWRHQAELAQIEIAQIKRQRLAAERRRASALRELNSHERQREHADEVLAFERDRNSRHALYLFMQRELAGLLRATFMLALRTAREAHTAFLFERVPPSSSLPLPSFSELWDDRIGSHSATQGNSAVHAGLMAGERLELALRRLELSYMSLNSREMELTKRISLRETFPREFVTLRQRGTCEIELPESIFDTDYPGHFLRRLRSVTVSIPCVSGPYTGVHCELRLLGSTIRIEPLLPAAKESCCCCAGSKQCTCASKRDALQHRRNSDTEPESHAYKSQADPYVVHRYTCASAVATSHGQDDAGLFELSFRDERYLPFEYEGAVSRWCIKLPRRYNLFDFSSLSDVVLSLNYTARDGGPRLRKLAQERLSRCGACDKDDGGCSVRGKVHWRGFEIRREFPDLWPRFERTGNGDCDDCHRTSHDYHKAKSASECEQPCSCSGGAHAGSRDHKCGSDEHRKIRTGHGTCEDECASPTLFRGPDCRHTFDVPLKLRRAMFPFFPGRKSVLVTTICISVSLRRPCQCSLDVACRCPGKRSPGRHFPVVFVPPGKEHCREDWRNVECVEQPAANVEDLWAENDESLCGAGEDYDDVFTCEIGDLSLGPIAEENARGQWSNSGKQIGREQETYGVLRFPRAMGDVVDVWLVCGYEIAGCCRVDDGKQARADTCNSRYSGSRHHYSGGRSKRRYFAEDDEQV